MLLGLCFQRWCDFSSWLDFRRLVRCCTMHYTYEGGGPTPLLDNPSVGICVVAMLEYFFVLFLSILAFVILNSSSPNCDRPFAQLLACIGAISMIAGILNMKVSYMDRACDWRWTQFIQVTLLITLAQSGVAVWGYIDLLYAMDTCWAEGNRAVIVLVLIIAILFFAVVVTNFLGFYFIFLPSFALQFRRLKKFK
eukprot:TRINITY_DN68705_c0_g1_i1.p1 TRINITY_DN68705_c0_g1~~TRINITY_DN68705_c0_g1_i1.p1  ORF type:complete len:195 (-),score=19.96 TRINITY_DN68705_c0_g1_i1:58-642(-)